MSSLNEVIVQAINSQSMPDINILLLFLLSVLWIGFKRCFSRERGVTSTESSFYFLLIYHQLSTSEIRVKKKIT